MTLFRINFSDKPHNETSMMLNPKIGDKQVYDYKPLSNFLIGIKIIKR